MSRRSRLRWRLSPRDAILRFRPLNERGEVHQPDCWSRCSRRIRIGNVSRSTTASLHGKLKPLPALFPEEERSKQPSAFSVLRALLDEFHASACVAAGAGGSIRLRSAVPVRSDRAEAAAPRREGSAPLPVRRHLFHGSQEGAASSAISSISRAATSPRAAWRAPRNSCSRAKKAKPVRAHRQRSHARRVHGQGRDGARRHAPGDYYEVVLRQTFRAPYSGSPSELFEKIQQASPSPYEFLLQFGDEQLIGASPEMFVRVEGRRVETCPIAGTARRTGDPLRDADNIRELLNSRQGRVRADDVHGRRPQR